MSLYNEIGGAPAVAAAVSAFYDRVTADPELGHYFESVDMNRLMAHQRAFIGAALGAQMPSRAARWPTPTPT